VAKFLSGVDRHFAGLLTSLNYEVIFAGAT